jgi:Heparinase II/III-like protein/Heparinase II/III N-terminus
MILRLLRRTGPRPGLIVRYVAFKVQRRLLDRRLRSGYPRLVASPPAGADLRAASLDIPSRGKLPAELRADAERLRSEAELVLQHRVSFLGSGLVSLGDEIDWHRDFKSGHRWPQAFYQDVEVTRLTDDSDAKVPWELSRGHQLLTLARAATLERDERFARELEKQLAGWIDANPPGFGINWVNPMEVAIRAVNWIWAIRTLEAWRPLQPSVRARVTRSLQSHARHIVANLEGSPLLRSNHYLSDILGVLALGTYLGDDSEARRWRKLAQRAFEREILAQVRDDGTGFEASTSYHGLALEIFLLARVIAADAGMPFSQRYDERLAAMLAVSAAIRHPGGRVPLIGDGDSGRILPGGFGRPATHDPLLWLGAAVLGSPAPLPGDPSPEVAWILGVDVWRQANERRAPTAAPPAGAFPAGGLYVLRGGDAHVVARCGDVGQGGAGGHAHNDVGSFELSLGGVPLVVDSGTYTYTADPRARNEFRSTTAHNTVVVDGEEINPLPQHELFALPQVAQVNVEDWRDGGPSARLVVSHDGYRRLSGNPVHRRLFELDRAAGELRVRDEIDGRGAHLVESLLHLAPGTEVSAIGDEVVELALERARATIRFWNARVEIDEAWVSDEFGVRERAPRVIARCKGAAPLDFGYTIAFELAGVTTTAGAATVTGARA